MLKFIQVVPIFLLVVFLAACGGSEGSVENPSSGVVQAAVSSPTSQTNDSAESPKAVVVQAAVSDPINEAIDSFENSSNDMAQIAANDQTNESNTTTTPISSDERVRLSADYADALPASTQLMIGSLQLEQDGLSMSETLATEILPFWQAYQALSNTDTTAQAELDAVINQIQDTMRPEQIQAIAALQLTSESALALMQEQGIVFGRDVDGGNAGGAAGVRGGGSLPGAGPADGGLPGQGRGAQVDPEARSGTKFDRFGDDNASVFLEQGVLPTLIRSLQVKTGEQEEEKLQPRGGSDARLLQPVSDASGVAVETLQTGMEEGKTLAEVITENGDGLDAAKEVMRGFFVGRGLEGEDLEQRVDAFFNGGAR